MPWTSFSRRRTVKIDFSIITSDYETEERNFPTPLRKFESFRIGEFRTYRNYEMLCENFAPLRRRGSGAFRPTDVKTRSLYLLSPVSVVEEWGWQRGGFLAGMRNQCERILSNENKIYHLKILRACSSQNFIKYSHPISIVSPRSLFGDSSFNISFPAFHIRVNPFYSGSFPSGMTGNRLACRKGLARRASESTRAVYSRLRMRNVYGTPHLRKRKRLCVYTYIIPTYVYIYNKYKSPLVLTLKDWNFVHRTWDRIPAQETTIFIDWTSLTIITDDLSSK